MLKKEAQIQKKSIMNKTWASKPNTPTIDIIAKSRYASGARTEGYGMS